MQRGRSYWHNHHPLSTVSDRSSVGRRSDFPPLLRRTVSGNLSQGGADRPSNPSYFVFPIVSAETAGEYIHFHIPYPAHTTFHHVFDVSSSPRKAAYRLGSRTHTHVHDV